MYKHFYFYFFRKYKNDVDIYKGFYLFRLHVEKIWQTLNET